MSSSGNGFGDDIKSRCSQSQYGADWLEPKWHVLFVRSNQERQVSLHLSVRAVEHFLPTYECISQRRDRKVKLFRPLFPGYVFVRLSLVDRLKALFVPNVVNLVGTSKAPSILSDREIDWIKVGVAHGKAKPHPHLNLKSGDTVMIKEGPMAGMEGVLITMQNGPRVLIRLNSISRAFAVEIDSLCIEPVRPRAALRPAC